LAKINKEEYAGAGAGAGTGAGVGTLATQASA